ncbi:hypothetical protein HNR42_003309 [Deinobacterium chartae]|uniref:Uncharacterized protein n=1 Tax=Deinobacterium chartae TaxID=521158 RepID=A0A841I6G8_9DEIO|nr:hypothetical protein [Deinobacterium chartae]MBB6099849.1 hypothetical protein [Deinobacterium chartae]
MLDTPEWRDLQDALEEIGIANAEPRSADDGRMLVAYVPSFDGYFTFVGDNLCLNIVNDDGDEEWHPVDSTEHLERLLEDFEPGYPYELDD